EELRDRAVTTAAHDLVVVGHLELGERVAGLERLAAHALRDELLLRRLRLLQVTALQIRRSRLPRRQEVHFAATRLATPAEIAVHADLAAGIDAALTGDHLLRVLRVDVERPRARVDADRDVLERVVAEDR